MTEKRQCVIVQFEGRHEETLPSIIHACNGAGYKPTVFLHRAAKRQRGDIFAQFGTLDADIIYQPLSDPQNWQMLNATVTDAATEFVIVTSLSRSRVANWIRGVEKPVIAIVHNLLQFQENREFSDILYGRHAAIGVLAHHVAAGLCKLAGPEFIDDIGVIEPVFWSDKPFKAAHTPNPVRKVAIPGAVNLRTRDFRGIIRAVSAYKSSKLNLRFQIVSGGKDRQKLENAVQEAGLESRFDFAPLSASGQVTHSEYFTRLEQSDLVHPLIPDDFTQYRDSKITSSIPGSVGFALPAIMDRWTAWTYRAPAFTSDADLEAGLDVLSALSDAEILAKRQALYDYRVGALHNNRQELNRLLSRISTR